MTQVYLFKYKLNVSPLNPIRIASNGITSVGAILPRFTLHPISSRKYNCCAFCGASHKIFSAGIFVKISKANFVEVSKLSSKSRGGFGTTGN